MNNVIPLQKIHLLYLRYLTCLVLQVRCLRKWLKEMEQRIDPLQFSKAAEWRSPRDRERKMAEYHVLQTDIEAHGRIVKLVLGRVRKNPFFYPAQWVFWFFLYICPEERVFGFFSFKNTFSLRCIQTLNYNHSY
jgi:hypothetical protein